MKLKDLVGYKLEKINDNNIIVSKDDKTYTLNFIEDSGDCCGYNELETELLIDENNKPVITDVVYEDCSSDDGWHDNNALKIIFFGGNKELAKISSLSSSGSGWCYGACVTVKCKELNINEELTSW